MARLFLALLLFTVSGPAFAAMREPGWKLYWVGRGAAAYVATHKGYSVLGNKASVSTYLENPETGSHSIVEEVFNCGSREYVTVTKTDYDKSGKVVKKYTNPDVEKSFRTFTVYDRQCLLFGGVCSPGDRPATLLEMRFYFLDFEREVRRVYRTPSPR
jgi:hypothetical protein